MAAKNTLNREQRQLLVSKLREQLSAKIQNAPTPPKLQPVTVQMPVIVQSSHWGGLRYDIVNEGKDAELGKYLPESYRKAKAVYEAAVKARQQKYDKLHQLVQQFEEELLFADKDLAALNERIASIIKQFSK